MLTLDELSLQLDHRQILKNIRFTLRNNRLTVLVGRNGSGKSALLSCINRQLPYTGSISLNGIDLAAYSPKQRAKAMALLPQQLPAPHITAQEMVAFGRNPHLDLTGHLRQADRLAIASALRDAGVEDLSSRYVDTLSGGERQRVALAMILAQDAPLALLDEPTAHMDQLHEAAFLRSLTVLKEQKQKTFLVVLHDLTTAVRYADDLLVLSHGRLVFSGSREECLQQEILERTFGVRRFTVQDRIFFSAE